MYIHRSEYSAYCICVYTHVHTPLSVQCLLYLSVYTCTHTAHCTVPTVSVCTQMYPHCSEYSAYCICVYIHVHTPLSVQCLLYPCVYTCTYTAQCTMPTASVCIHMYTHRSVDNAYCIRVHTHVHTPLSVQCLLYLGVYTCTHTAQCTMPTVSVCIYMYTHRSMYSADRIIRQCVPLFAFEGIFFLSVRPGVTLTMNVGGRALTQLAHWVSRLLCMCGWAVPLPPTSFVHQVVNY